MKKLLVLFAIVSLFAFAGSAMAYDPGDDVAGHYELLSDAVGHYTGSDVAGHIDGTYGTGAYDWYLSYSPALAAASEDIGEDVLDEIGDLFGGLDATQVKPGSMTSGNADTQEDFIIGLLGTVDVYFPFGALPTFNFTSFNVAEGDVAVINLGTVLTASSNMVLKLFASTAATAINSNMYIITKNGSADAVKHENNATTSFTEGDKVYLAFVVGSSSTNPVKGAAFTSGSFSPVAATVSSSGGSLGGSGGGCAMGTSALALAVLGLFIAKRRG